MNFELIDNCFQVAVLIAAAIAAIAAAFRHRDRRFLILALFFACVSMGTLYWVLHIFIFDNVPQVFYVAEFSWLAAYLFLLSFQILRIDPVKPLVSLPALLCALFTAAVSDWRPAEYSPVKLKSGKEAGGMGEQCVRFVPNPDIAATLGAAKRAGQVQVVYAAETGNPLPAARGKLQRKNAELCVANDVSSGVGFGTPDNRVWLVEAGSEQELPLLSKRQLAGRILDRVAQLLA